MKICPKCQIQLEDNLIFCTKCGTKLSTARICSSCGKPLKVGANYCVHCGCRIGSTCNNENTSLAQTHPQVESEKLLSCSEKKGFKKTYVLIVSVCVVVLIALTACLVIMWTNNSIGHSSQQINATSTVDSSQFIQEVEPIESENDYISSELGSLKPCFNDIFSITFKKDYVADACGENTWSSDSSHVFRKNEVVWNLSIDGGVEADSDGYFVYIKSENDFFIPSEIVKKEVFQTGKIPSSILDKAILCFRSTSGEVLQLFKLDRNGHTLYDTGETIIKRNVYILKDGTNYFEYDESVQPMCLEEYYGESDGQIDEKGKLLCNYMLAPMGWLPIYFYVPSRKAFLCEGTWYYYHSATPIQ